MINYQSTITFIIRTSSISAMLTMTELRELPCQLPKKNKNIKIETSRKRSLIEFLAVPSSNRLHFHRLCPSVMKRRRGIFATAKSLRLKRWVKLEKGHPAIFCSYLVQANSILPKITHLRELLFCLTHYSSHF